MAIPRRRTSRSNTPNRRSQWKATPPNLVALTIAGETYRLPRAPVPAVQRDYVSPAPRGAR
ncbi:MAG: 50S ribosomal protein L32 [Nocardioides sp.]